MFKKCFITILSLMYKIILTGEQTTVTKREFCESFENLSIYNLSLSLMLLPHQIISYLIQIHQLYL